jgi:hypothetical protein
MHFNYKIIMYAQRAPYISELKLFSSFLVSWGGVRLSPLGTSATNWLILPAPDDR